MSEKKFECEVSAYADAADACPKAFVHRSKNGWVAGGAGANQPPHPFHVWIENTSWTFQKALAFIRFDDYNYIVIL